MRLQKVHSRQSRYEELSVLYLDPGNLDRSSPRRKPNQSKTARLPLRRIPSRPALTVRLREVSGL